MDSLSTRIAADKPPEQPSVPGESVILPPTFRIGTLNGKVTLSPRLIRSLLFVHLKCDKLSRFHPRLELGWLGGQSCRASANSHFGVLLLALLDKPSFTGSNARSDSSHDSDTEAHPGLARKRPARRGTGTTSWRSVHRCELERRHFGPDPLESNMHQVN